MIYLDVSEIMEGEHVEVLIRTLLILLIEITAVTTVS